jgi:hypothetical protein
MSILMDAAVTAATIMIGYCGITGKFVKNSEQRREALSRVT